MIINYKLYTENLNYKYPYERIIILINGIVDYHSVFDFIENEFDIEINKIRSDETLINTNLIHIALSVPNLYNALNGVFRSIDETDILRFYSTQFNNIDSMLKVINDTVGSYYYNEKDILTLKDLKSIKHLLLYGRKNDFYYMYNKPKENIYESLLDKLEGPKAEEVLDGTKDKNLEDRFYFIIKADYFDGFKELLNQLDNRIKYKLIYFNKEKKYGLFKYILKTLLQENRLDMFNYLIDKYKLMENKTFITDVIKSNYINPLFYKAISDMGINLSFKNIILTHQNIKLLIDNGVDIHSDSDYLIKSLIENDNLTDFRFIINEYKNEFNEKMLLYYIIENKANTILYYVLKYMKFDVNTQINMNDFNGSLIELAVNKNSYDTVDMLLNFNPIVSEKTLKYTHDNGFVKIYSKLYSYLKAKKRNEKN